MSLSLVATNLDGLEPLTSSELLALQAEQFEHDEKYHREIARLSVQDRMRHMTLHFSKYVGRLLQGDTDDQQLIVDTFIIALSSANILGIHLTSNVQTECLTKQDFAVRLGVATGMMSAACEKLDHLEDFPFRQVLIEGVIDIIAAAISHSLARKMDLSALVRSRLAGVRGKAFAPGKA